MNGGRLARLSSPLHARSFRRIWLAMLASEIGDWAGRLALSLLVYQRTQSPALTAAVTTVAVAPYVGIGQAVTAKLSRLPARRSLIACDIVRAGLYLTMATNPSVALLLLLEFANGAFSVPFESVRSAVLPATVPEGRYGDALALTTMTKELALLVGYAGGGALFAAIGPQSLLAVNGVTFLVSAILLLGLPRPRRRQVQAREESKTNLAAALRFVLDDPLVRRCALCYALASGCALVGEALAPVLVEQELGGGSTAVGLLSAVIAASVIAFAFVLPRDGSAKRLVRISASSALVGCFVGGLTFAVDLRLPTAALPFVALGGVFAARVSAYQVVGTRAPEELRASTFSIVVGLISATTLAIPLLAGVVADHVGIRPTMVLFPLLGAAAALVAIVAPLSDRPPSSQPSR